MAFADNESNNTIRATKSCKVVFQDYLNEKKLKFPETCEELAVVLQRFYPEVRKKDGSQYTMNSLYSLRFGLNRIFKGLLNVDIIKGEEFDQANREYEAQCKNLRRKGLAKTEHKPPIADEDIKKLYESGVFSSDSPITLQNKVFFEIMFYFCRRGRQNLRQLKKADFVIKENAQGQRCVVKTEPKNERMDDGGEKGGMMVANNGSPLCPVLSFEKYLSHLNPLNEFLFQRPREKNNWSSDCLVWYDNNVVGENNLGRKMKELSIQAKLSVEYTNHSIKATTITILSRNGFAAKHIVSLSGPKLDSSLRTHVSKTDKNTQTDMADCLMSFIKNNKKRSDGINSTADTYLNQTKKRKLDNEFSKESPKNEHVHHNVPMEVSVPVQVNHDENIAPLPEVTKSRRKSSQVRKVVRTDVPSVEEETNMSQVYIKSEATSSEGLQEPRCNERYAMLQDMTPTTMCRVLTSSGSENMSIQPEHEIIVAVNRASETTVIEEDYQRKYFQLLNTMNDLQDKFLVSQRNFEDLVQARETYINELRRTLEDKNQENVSTKLELERSNNKIVELEEKRKTHVENIENLDKRVEDMKKAEMKRQLLKDGEVQVQRVIEKQQQEVLEFYKLLTSVTVEKVMTDDNDDSLTVCAKFRCSVKTARTQELKFMLSHDPEFAEVEYTPLALDSQSVDASFPEYLKEQIFFESDQAPNFLSRLIQKIQNPDEK